MIQFDRSHAANLHPPYGLWIVQHKGIVIGRQLSYPSQDDCERMLRVHRESKQHEGPADPGIPKTVSYHLGGAAATKTSQRRGGYNKRGKTHRRRGAA